MKLQVIMVFDSVACACARAGFSVSICPLTQLRQLPVMTVIKSAIPISRSGALAAICFALLACNQPVTTTADADPREWPGFSYDLDLPAPLSARNSTGACSATGVSLDDARARYAAQCDLPRVDCDPHQGGWICSSGNITSQAQSQTPSNVPYVSESYSSQPVDPASWDYEAVYQRPGYELVFSDEFNGSEINPARWNTQLRWDGEYNGAWYEYRIINGEKQFYVNVLSEDSEHRDTVLPVYNPFTFDGSHLSIRAASNPLLEARVPTVNEQQGRGVSYGGLQSLLKRQPFLSGALSTHGKFSQKYGYFEARIRIPSHPGTFPAFWLYHQRERWQGTKRSEIDIMENLGHAPQYIYNSYHYSDNVSVYYPGDPNFLKPEPNGQIYTGEDFSREFHLYAVDWQPGSITWYIDNQPVSTLNDPGVDNEELYVILNLAIGGNWVNYPESAGGLGRQGDNLYPNMDEQQSAVFGAPELEIDYVRVFRKTP